MMGAEPGSSFRPGTVETEQVSCNPFDGSGRVRFHITGVVVDDTPQRKTTAYPGTYVADGEFVITGTPSSAGSVMRTLSSYTTHFTITSGDKRVTGTSTLRPGAVTQGKCGDWDGGSYGYHRQYIVGWAQTQYTAEVRTADGTLLRRDAGTNESSLQDIVGPTGSVAHRDRAFVSQDTDEDGIVTGTDNCPAATNADQADHDGDAQGDACDADDDNDGVSDEQDAFPRDAGESVDTDADGTGNNADSDDDGDEVADGDDAFPLDRDESVDTDSDGTGNRADTDDDNDDVADADDAFPLDRDESVDTDADGTGNNADSDDDGDEVADADDAFPLDKDESADTDADGVGNNADTDDDGDERADDADAFPLDKTEWADVDADGTGDNADADDDNDTVSDETDNCRLEANTDQADLDGDGAGDRCDSDRDGDAVDNGVDNCADVANDQVDTDADGKGDACDADDDNDGAEDAADNCPTVASASQRDSDGDGRGDACDDAFDSTDGLTAGGGWLTGASGQKIHFAYSALSFRGRIAGIGELRDGTKRIRLVTADGYSQADRRAVVVGDAIVDGARVRYRLETVDAGEPGRGRDTFELDAGSYRAAGTLAGGNIEVTR
jgi:hypothetical protein